MWSGMRQQLELAPELESNLQNTVDCGRKWLVDFNPAKTQPGLFSWSYNSGAVDVKINRSFSEEK